MTSTRTIAPPHLDMRALGDRALGYLRTIVAVDSASDERSESIPSTPGQAALAKLVGRFFRTYGAEVELDDFANVIATFPGRGVGVGQAPVAFMVHLDTARGTHATSALEVVRGWDGTALSYASNPGLQVSVANYPTLVDFVGHDVVHGPGDAPFGLDDKLGLTHLMSLATLLSEGPEVDHPPLVLIGRPDEEVGRMAAVEGLAVTLAERGVDFGYTVDGILPYEVNVENFNAAGARVTFAPRGVDVPDAHFVSLAIGGVNTHGCTAKAEGHRPATRLAAELLAKVDALQVVPVAFVSDDLRDCDGVLTLALADSGLLADVRAAAEQVVGPHRPRGASLRISSVDAPVDVTSAGATADALAFIGRFLISEGVYPVAAEASEGREGYSQPYRLLPLETQGAVAVDVRLRDFDTAGLDARVAHVRAQAPAGAQVTVTRQYVNMAPRLADRPELVRWPTEAAAGQGVRAQELPIRGGTGVDPFLDAGVPVANLGTGYFAPESEKELTSLQHMAGHAAWLFGLVQHIAQARAAQSKRGAAATTA